MTPTRLRFGSWFNWYAPYCCFYVSDNKVFIFFIRSMCFRCLLTSIEFVSNCGTMVGIRSVGVGERQSENSFVCFGAKLTHSAYTRDFLRDRKKTRKGKVPEQNRRELATVRERWRSERGGCWSEELELVDPEARWVSVPGNWVEISFGYTLAIATECHNSAKTFPFLRLGLTQVCSCLLFFLPLSVIYFIYVVYL